MSYDGETIHYAGEGTIAPELIHDDHAYYGVALDVPKGAKSVSVVINDGEPEELDLSEDGEFVVDGTPIEYFAFATSGGAKMAASRWIMDCTWHLPGGNKQTRTVIRRA